MQTAFGSGTMWAVPTINLAGNNVAVPTPVPFGAMQDVALDSTFTVKELYGLYQFPIDVGRGTAKLTGKAKVAQFNAELFNQVFGETLSANEYKATYRESGTVANNNLTVAAGANFYLDLGVQYASNGTRLTRIAANANAAGQYIVGANGLYTFSANDANTAMKVSYLYIGNNTGGNSFVVQNQLLGLQPFFKVAFNVVRAAKHWTLIFNKCTSTKLSFATKLEDFTVPEFDFSMMADDAGNVFTFSVAEP